MANADDDSSNEGDSSRGAVKPIRRTLMGLGFARANLPPEPDEFVGESTDVSDFGDVIDASGERAVRDAVDRAWDSMFSDSEAEEAIGGDEAYDDDNPWDDPADPVPDTDPRSVLNIVAADARDPRDTLPLPDVDPLWTATEDAEPLPEPIRPTNPEPLPESIRASLREYIGDNTAITEFEGGATELLDSPFESDPTVAKLVAQDGPAAGQEFFATSLRNTVGRGTTNTIVVPDVAMSRQHFEIVRNPDDSFALVDLQSINGTTLNGTKVKEADLYHGDCVEAGKSSFQFVLTPNVGAPSRERRLVPAVTSTLSNKAAPPRPAAGGSTQRMLLRVGIAAIVVIAVLFGAVMLLQSGRPVAQKPKPAGPDAAATYLLGVEAVKAHNWEQATQHFEHARALDPTLLGVEDQLHRIKAERLAGSQLADAQRKLEKGDLTAAISVADLIGEDSTYAAQAEELRQDARKAEVLSLYGRAQAAHVAGDAPQARHFANEVVARAPSHRGAQALLEELETSAAESTPDVGVPEDDTPPPKRDDTWEFELVGSKKSGGSGSGKPKTGARVPNLTQGFLLYRTRKFEEAEKFFAKAAAKPGPGAANSKRIAGAVMKFRKNYASGVAAFDARQWPLAQKKLTAARRADSIVGDYFAAELRTKLATVWAKLGVQRVQKKDFVGARKLLDKSRVLNAKDGTAKELQQELTAAARSLYFEAEALKQSDPAKAAKLCRQITTIVDASNASHKKAKTLLDSF